MFRINIKASRLTISKRYPGLQIRSPKASKTNFYIAAFETINKSGSYDYWVTKSYILLGDIYFRQKDYFNAKATFQSIIDNTLSPEFKSEAQAKLNQVVEEESKSSKVEN